MLKRLWRKVKKHFHGVIKQPGTPHEIALGFAIGTFVVILPTFMLNIVICILISLIYKKINNIALFGAIVVWNPIVIFPIYGLTLKFGDLLFGALPVVDYEYTLWDQVYRHSRRFLIALCIIAAVIAALSYVIVYFSVYLIQKNRSHVPN